MTEFTLIIWGHGDFDAIPFDNVEEARRIGETACARHGVGAYTITNDDNKGNLRQYLFQRVDGAWKLRGKQTATYGNLKRWFA